MKTEMSESLTDILRRAIGRVTQAEARRRRRACYKSSGKGKAMPVDPSRMASLFAEDDEKMGVTPCAVVAKITTTASGDGSVERERGRR
jgi:hypothetical protein